MTIVSTTWSSGVLGDKRQTSCVATAGQNKLGAYYHAAGNLEIRQNSDGSIDIRQTSLTLEQNGISNATSSGGWGSDTWTFHGLYVSRSPFSLYDGPEGPSGFGEGVKVWSEGHISHEGYGTGNASNHYTWLSSGGSTGWQRIANSINEVEHTGNTEVFLYLGGLIDFASSATNGINIDAERVIMRPESDFSDFFEYYPWAIRKNGEWQSLNREGPKSTTAGLFIRKNGVFRPCTNRPGDDTSNDHGFMRVNGVWRKSPKLGKGA